jgi:hypothetical protein
VITTAGANDNNYNFSYANGTLTITKAPLAVQVGNATRIEGDPEPLFTYLITSGLKNGDLSTVLTGVSLTTPANIFSPMGAYAINGAGGSATNYYVASYSPGVLTITSGTVAVRSVTTIPSTVYYTNSLGLRKDWVRWRDLIYYEDEEFIEQILFGRQSAKRRYVF